MTETEKKAFAIAEACKKAGITMAGAAGILANIEAESAFSSINVQDSYESRVGDDRTYTQKVDNGTYLSFAVDSAGYGLCQWTAGDRKFNLLQYARGLKKSIGDFDMQVAFMIHEMKSYTKAWRTVTTSNDAYECGAAVCKYYEIPANTDAQAQIRGNAAVKWLQFLNNIKDSGQKPEAPKESTEEKPKLESWPPRTIDENCKGFPEVRLLQALLVCHGYHVLMDGIWADNLTTKLKDFQYNAGLKDDGICGPLTWAKLMER